MAAPEVKIRVIVDGGQVKVGIAGVKADLKGLGSATVSAGAVGANGLQQINDKLTQVQDGLATVGKFAGLYLGFGALKVGIQNLLQAQLALQGIKNGLVAATGSAAAGAREFEFLAGLAERVGVRLVESGQAYSSYMASAKAANLTTAETRDLFTAVAEAGAVFNLNAGNMQSALLGLQQMMSMGVIRSQELRMQLGSQLPGAFSNFKRLVEEDGGVDFNFEDALSKGLLDVKKYGPILAAAVRESFSAEDVAKAADDLNSQMAKLENAVVKFKASLTEGEFSQLYSGLLGGIANVLTAMTNLGGGIAPQVVSVAAITAGVLAFVKAANVASAAVVRTTSTVAALAGIGKVGAAVHTIQAVEALNAAKATQVLAATQMELATASTIAAQAETRLAATELALASAHLKVVQAEGAQSVASGQLSLAEQRLAAAHDRVKAAAIAEAGATAQGTIAKQKMIVVDNALVVAENKATAATVRHTGAMGAMRVAGGLLKTGLSGILALLGGWPGIVIAAAAALVYFATKATDAENATAGFISKLQAGRDAMLEFSGQMAELTGLRVALAAAEKAGDKAEVARLKDTIGLRSTEMAGKRADITQAQRIAKDNRILALQGVERAKEALKVVKNNNVLNFSLNGAANLKFLQNIRKAEQELYESRKRAGEALVDVNKSNRLLSKSAWDAQLTEATDARNSAVELAGETSAAAEKARADAARATAEKADPSLVLKNRIAAAIEDKSSKVVGGFDKLSAATQLKFKEDITAAITTEYKAELALKALNSKATGTKKEKNTADADGKRLAEEQAAALKAVEGTLGSLTDTTRENTDALREADPIRDKMEDSLRALAREVKGAEEELADSKLTDDQKAIALAKIKLEAEGAAAAILKLADSERLRALQDATAAAEASNNEDAFRNSQDKLRNSRTPGSQDAADRNDINAYYQGKADELTKNFGGNVADGAGKAAMDRLNANWKTTLQDMSTEARRQGEAIEDALAGSFTNTIMSMLNGGMTLQEGLTQIFMAIFNTFMENMVVRPLAEMAARWVQENVLQRAAMLTQVTTQAAGSAAVMGAKTAETTTVVAENAAQAGSGAAASQASIPYIGPVLAIAAMLAIVAAIMAMRKKSQKKSKGGLIEGRGSSTSDSIPIHGSDGEYMIKATSVKKYGVGFMDMVNQGRLGRSPMAQVHTPKTKFAEGGLVMGSPNMPQKGERAAPGVRVVNVIDPRLFEDYIASPQGEKLILNVIERNPRRVKSSIG